MSAFLREMLSPSATPALLREINRCLDRRSQATRIGLASCRQIESRAVVNRGADNGQPQRDINCIMKSQRLEYRQTLVMVHRQIRVGLRPQTRDKRAVGGYRSKDIQPFTAEHLANGCND